MPSYRRVTRGLVIPGHRLGDDLLLPFRREGQAKGGDATLTPLATLPLPSALEPPTMQYRIGGPYTLSHRPRTHSQGLACSFAWVAATSGDAP